MSTKWFVFILLFASVCSASAVIRTPPASFQRNCGYQAKAPVYEADKSFMRSTTLQNAGNACANTSSPTRNTAFADYYRAAADQCWQTNPHSQNPTYASIVYLCSIQDNPGAYGKLDKTYCANQEKMLQSAKAMCDAAYDAVRKKRCNIAGSGPTAKVTCESER